LRIPGPLRQGLGERLLQRLPQFMTSQDVLGRRHRLSRWLPRIGALLLEPDDRALYRRMISHHPTPEVMIPGAAELATVYNDPAHWVYTLPSWRAVALADTLVYLPNDILTKVDRASMAVSLGTRIPLLDHRLVAFACALSKTQVIDAAGGKRPLRRILQRFVPESLTNRPKQGGGVPLNRWLRGPLRTWIGDVLSESRLRAQELLHVDTVLAMRDAHLAGQADLGPELWDFAMLTAWFDQR